MKKLIASNSVQFDLDTPNLISEYMEENKPLFDQGVYTRGRKMNCVTKCKESSDKRVLNPIKSSYPLTDYLIQLVDDSWPILTVGSSNQMVACSSSNIVTTDITRSQLIERPVRINKMFQVPLDTNWDSVYFNNGTYKLVPDCMNCIVTPNKVHTHTKHCALFDNGNNNIVKTCFSCGSVALSKPEVKKVRTAMSLVVSLKEDTTEYEDLVEDIIIEVEAFNLRREETTGNILKPVFEGCTFAYTQWLQPKKFLNKIFRNNHIYKKNVAFIDKLDKYLREIDDDRF